MALLEIEDLHTYLYTRWGTVKAVDGTSFSLERGKTLGLVGESGCGKSMTLLSILRLLPWPAGRIVSGRILFDGEDLVQKSEGELEKIRGKRIGMIPQDPYTSLNPVFNIEKQMTEPIQIHLGLKKRQVLKERVTEILRKVRIGDPEKRLECYPHQLSGGMRQRVVGGISISCNPDLIIADEPTTALDVSVQAQYINLIRDIQSTYNVALLYVSHDLSLIFRICDQVAVMYAGKIVEKGSVHEIFKETLHPYSRALVTSIPPVDCDIERLPSIPGQPPKLFALPQGCYFAPRCPHAMDKCRQAYPEEFFVSEGHSVSCWRYA
ncbi:MAG: ABC transporter ATP-binding protein [Deltaproteobacteria bacterium]|nr:ABC transporter ATP-binding protein [Deltaproteobacteria bacterium]